MFSDYTASGNNICAMQLKNATVHESAEPKLSSLLIDRCDNILKILTRSETEQIIYPRSLTENGSIFSDFIAGCRFMQILRK